MPDHLLTPISASVIDHNLAVNVAPADQAGPARSA
jgi:hypothetical protein